MGVPMSQRPGQLTLEKELGDFLYKVLTGSVTQEYRNQLANWEIHTNSLIACARNASKHQKAWLDWAKKDHQSSVARLNALALLGLSLVTGPGLSFYPGMCSIGWSPGSLIINTNATCPIPNGLRRLPIPSRSQFIPCPNQRVKCPGRQNRSN